MVERQFSKIEIMGKGELKITTNRGAKIIVEQAAPRNIIDNGKLDKKRELNFPPGTIESLRPLLRGVTGADTSENADGYWMGVDEMVSMTQETAVNKLKRAGIGHVATARMLIQSDPLISLGLAHNNFSHEDVELKITEVAGFLRPLFQTRKSKN